MQARRAALAGPFAAYLGAQASWFFAFGLQTALFPYVTRQLLSANAAQVGLAQTSLTAPTILLILFGGVAAERLDRRRLLALLHAAAVVPPILLAYAISTGNLTFASLIAYGLAMGAIGAVMLPTRDAALNAVATAQGGLSLQRAVVLASLVQFGGQIAGMAVASAASFSGPVALMSVQAIALALGGAAVALMPRLVPAQSAEGSTTVLGQLSEGLRIVWGLPTIRVMVIAMFAVGVFVIGASFLVLLPLLVLDQFGGLRALGVVLMTFWTGAAGAAIVLSRFTHVRRPGRVLAVTLAVGAVSLSSLAIDIPFVALLILVFVWGASAGVGIAMSRAIVQDAAPPEALARVLSIYQLGFLGGAPIGALAAGLIAEHIGIARTVFIPMAGIAAAAAWLAFFTPVGRLYERAP